MIYKKIINILLVFFCTSSIFAGTVTWDGGAGTLVWSTAANWDTDVAPIAGDDVVFNTPGTYTITSVPTLAINSLTISSGTITFSGATTTLTIGGNAGTDFTIAASQALTLTGTGNIINITMAASATSSISGTFTINSGATWTTSNASTVMTVNSGGSISNSGTITGATAAKLIFEGTSTYYHAQAAGTIPTSDWDGATGTATSTCYVTGATTAAPSGLSQTFYNFTWNCSSQTGAASFAGITMVCNLFTVTSTNTGYLSGGSSGTNTTTITGNMQMDAGTLYVIPSGSGASNTWTVSGNFTFNGGTIYVDAGNSPPQTGNFYVGSIFTLSGGTFNLNSATSGSAYGYFYAQGNFVHSSGTFTSTNTNAGCTTLYFDGTSTYTKSGGTFTNTYLAITVNSTKTLTLGSDISIASGRTFTNSGTLAFGTGSTDQTNSFNVTGAGAFTVTSAATSITKITSKDGMLTGANAIGNVQVTGTRTYGSAGIYHFIGDKPQVTGDFAATVGGLTFNNSTGVTLSQNITISNGGTLTLTTGYHDLSSYTLTIGTSASANTLTYTAGGLYSSTNTGSFKRYIPNTVTLTTTSPAYGLFPFARSSTNIGNVKITTTANVTAGGYVSMIPTFSADNVVTCSVADGGNTIVRAQVGNTVDVTVSSMTGGTNVKIEYDCGSNLDATGSASDLCLVTYNASTVSTVGTHVANAGTKTSPQVARNTIASIATLNSNKFCLATYNSGSPVGFTCTLSGVKTVGPTGNYSTLTSAVNDLSSSGMLSSVTLELQTTYVSTYEIFPIILSNFSCASSSITLTIYPNSSATGLSISGNKSGGSIITIDGGDYITIDGRPGGSGTSELSIINTATAAASNRAVVIQTNATNNTIQYCTIKADNSSTTVGTAGIVYLGDATTGNNSNVIDNCNFTYASSSTNALIVNNNTAGTTTPLTISNSSFYDYDYRAIWNETGGTAFTISTNSFYLTASSDPGAATSSAIYMLVGSGYTISSNTIGGANSSAGGSAYTLSSASATRFVPIYVYQTSNSTTSIQGNTIKNISLSTTDGSTTTFGTFTGIYVDNATNAGATGTLNIGTTTANMIGDTTASASNDITITSTTSAGVSQGIALLSDGTTSVQNNLIGDFNTSNVSTKGYTFYGINVGGTGSMTVSSNKIGSLASANSIVLGGGSTGTGVCKFYGIHNNGTGVTTLNSNSIGNVAVYGTSTSNLIYGIYNNANTTATSYIQSNTIKALDMTGASTSSDIFVIANTSVNSITISSNTMTSFTETAGDFWGIYNNCNATGTHTISSNTLNTVSLAYSTGTFKGIELVGTGTYTCSSNTIQNITSSVTGTYYGLAFTAASTITANTNVVKTITTNVAASNTIIGIYCASTGTYNLSGNNLADFTNISSGAGAPTIAGIKFAAANASSTVQKNRMTGYAANLTSTPKIYGIWNASTGTTLLYNNLFVCSNGAYTNDIEIAGICDGTIAAGTAAITTLYYNTISITGSTASGSGITTACYSHYEGTANKIQACKNNIFNNQRTVTAGTSIHYCYLLGANTNVVAGGGTDYNYYSAPNDTYFGYPGAQKTYATFAVATQGYGGTNSKYYTSTSGNSSAITVNTDGTLGSSDYATVAVGADLYDAGPNITDDIIGTTRAHVHGTSSGYKGCMEGAPSTYYWVGGTGNWSDASNHWAFASGGLACASSAPSTSSNVVFDGNSSAGTCTIDAAAYASDLTMTGYTGTLAGSSALDIYGSLTVGAGMTWTHSGTTSFKSTSTGKTITSNGKTLTCPITFNGSGGGWTLADALTCSSTSAFTLTAGTLDLSSYTLSIAGDFTKATAFTFTPSTGTVTFTGNSSAINGTTAAPSFYNIVVNKTAGQTLSTGGSVTSLTCSNNFTETTGNFTAPANMTISGDMTVSAGTFTAPSGTLTLVGNYTSNSTYTANSGTFKFNGTSAQTLSGSTNPNFYNLIIDNSSTGVSLGLNATMTNTLTLTNGLLKTVSYTLTLGADGSNATIPAGSSSSYIVAYNNAGTIGYVKQFVNSNNTYNFPIGDATNFTPLTFTLNSNGGLSSAYLICHTKAAKITGMNSGITTYITRYWELTDNGFTTPNYDINYTYVTTDITGTEANLRPIKKSGATWYKPAGTSFTDGTTQGAYLLDEALNKLTWTGLTTFSFFGGGGNQAVALPVELYQFDVKKHQESAKINWKTANEIDNDYFILERSSDGIEFTPIAKIKGAGNSTSPLSYFYLDYDYRNSINYYHLKQVDFNGKETISETKSIDMSKVDGVIIMTVNSIGQEVDVNYRGVVFDIYSDGSSKKRIQ